MGNSFNAIRDRLFNYLLTGFIAGCSSFFIWSGSAILDRPTRDEVTDMIETQAPYIRDKRAIDDRLQSMEMIERELAEVIRRNTDAIVALRLQLAKLEQ